MSFKLLIFPDPIDSTCVLYHDTGFTFVGKPNMHPSGRPAQAFDFPETLTNGWGALLVISHTGKVTLNQKGILWLNTPNLDYPWTPGQTAAFAADDFILANEIMIPVPVPPPTPSPTKDPFQIIKNTYNAGSYDLTTREGCGIFIEAACKALHEQSSTNWGHIEKTGRQNQYNGHAVDAIALKASIAGTAAGVYDIVVQSEAPDAHLGFNRTSDVDLSLWYYPA